MYEIDTCMFIHNGTIWRIKNEWVYQTWLYSLKWNRRILRYIFEGFSIDNSVQQLPWILTILLYKKNVFAEDVLNGACHYVTGPATRNFTCTVTGKRCNLGKYFTSFFAFVLPLSLYQPDVCVLYILQTSRWLRLTTTQCVISVTPWTKTERQRFLYQRHK